MDLALSGTCNGDSRSRTLELRSGHGQRLSLTFWAEGSGGMPHHLRRYPGASRAGGSNNGNGRGGRRAPLTINIGI